MLPFLLTRVGSEAKKIYSLELAAALQQFADSGGPNYRFLNAKTYLKKQGWKEFVQQSPFRNQVDQYFCEQYYKSMDDYKEAAETFRINEVMSGYINSQPLSLHLSLEVPGSQVAVPYMFLLRDNKQWRGTLYLAPDHPDAVLTRFKNGPGSHWLDQLEVAYPDYVIISADGNPKTILRANQ